MRAFVTPKERETLRQAKAVRAGINKRIRDDRPKHQVSAGQRKPRERDRVYLQWIRTLPCVACAVEGKRVFGCHAAHVRYADAAAGWANPGLQSKPDDRRALPLCPDHHLNGPAAQHRANERGWWAALGIEPPMLCAALSVDFNGGGDGRAIIGAFTRKIER